MSSIIFNFLLPAVDRPVERLIQSAEINTIARTAVKDQRSILTAKLADLPTNPGAG